MKRNDVLSPGRPCARFLPPLALAALCACASGQSILPAGGPPDTTAPFIVSTTPEQGATNVPTDAEIEIEFSEYLKETNVSSSVTITPIPKLAPDYSWSGRSLVMAFDQPLAENRTYTVTIGSSISDNAGNRLGRPYSLRFATGPEIDSGSISGEVSGRSKIPAYVFAWRLPDEIIANDSRFRPDSTDPDFIAPIGDDGRFSLEGLPTGRFRLIAVSDASSDRRFTPGEDAFGVPTGDVTLARQDHPVSGIQIRLRAAPDDIGRPSLYAASSIDRNRSELRFSEPIDTAGIRPDRFSLSVDGTTYAIHAAWRSGSNRLAIGLLHDPLPDGALATARAMGITDTAGNDIVDTASTATFTVSSIVDAVPPLLLPTTVDSAHPYTFPDSIRIAFDKPVQTRQTEGAVAMRDSAGTMVPFKLERRSPAEFLARPLDTLFGSTRAWLEIDLRRFSDAAGNHADSTARILVALLPIRQLGSLEGSIIDSARPEAAHVLVLRERSTGRTLTLRNLPAGKWSIPAIHEGEYDVTAFRDDDHNGEYDYGSAIPWRVAETFVTWRGTVRVRPRWTTSNVDLVMGNRDAK